MSPEQLAVAPYRTVHLGDVLDAAAGLVAIGLLALVYADRPGVPRILLAVGFAFFVPGRAIVTNWPRLAQWSEAAMSVVLSLTVATLLAAAALWAHAWHPDLLLSVVAWVSVAALAIGVARRHASAFGAHGADRSWSSGRDGRAGTSTHAG